MKQINRVVRFRTIKTRQAIGRTIAESGRRGMFFISVAYVKNESHRMYKPYPPKAVRLTLNPRYFLWFLIPKICTILIKMFRKSNSKLILSFTTSFFTIPALANRA